MSKAPCPDTSQHQPTLIGLASAVPKSWSQQDLHEQILRHWYRRLPAAESLIQHSGVERRHLYLDPFEAMRAPRMPTGDRMRLWKQGAMDLSRRSMTEALAGFDTRLLGSLVMVSCTGYDTPSPDLLLAEELGLSPHLRRTFVGHMGCFAAFNGLKVALDALAARPDEAALVVCTELSSVHLRDEATVEQAVCHALFADASVALLIANAPPGTGPRFLHGHTQTLYAHTDAMGWSILNDGFRMHLSPEVPSLLEGAARGFVERLLEPPGLQPQDIQHWMLHPGGPSIVKAVGRALDLSEQDLVPTREVLRTHGNCSSATVLLVLQHVMNEVRPRPGEYGVMLGFGPGLTLEGMVLRF